MTEQKFSDYLQSRVAAMRLDRSSFISQYMDISKFIAPRRGRFQIDDVNKGDRRHDSIINSEASYALGVATSGLLAGIMSPSRPWFMLENSDPELMEYQPVQDWCQKVASKISTVFNSGNLYQMAPLLIREVLLFGTSLMTHVDDYEDVARFYTHTAGAYMVAQNYRCEVDTFAREYQATVRQIVTEFGLKNVSDSVKNQWDKGNYDSWYPCVHFVEPNQEYNDSKTLNKNKKFSSTYYQPDAISSQKYLKQSGFDEFPGYCLRWDVTAEDTYGTDCPGMTTLGNVKQLQLEEKRKAQGLDKMVSPPLHGPPSLRNVAVSSMPGGLTIYDGNEQQTLKPIYEVNLPLQHLTLDIKEVERRIDRDFYVDLFLAFSNIEGIQPRNQMDLIERNQERLLQIGPALERFHGEFLGKMINRSFNQLARAKALPPIPPELGGKEIRPKYISPLAMAQRAVGTGAIERVTGYVGGVMKAGVMQASDKVDWDQSIDEYSKAVGAPARIIVPDEVVAQRRKERERAQQQERTLQMAQAGANTVKTMADAKMDAPNALSQLQDTLHGRSRKTR